MNLQEYNAFAERLRRNLEADPRVLGLIAVGSMSQQDTRPDDWSDHDFLVVVQPGAQEALRSDVSWLPDADRVALRYRETEHGQKLLYESGHMIEFAVFDPDELRVGRFNRFRVLLDRAELQRRMEEIVAATREARHAEAPSDAYAIGQVLTGALIAHGRWTRGERLSARSFLINMAVPNLVQLLRKYGAAAGGTGGMGGTGTDDNLDPLRRFEFVHSAVGAALNEVLDRPLPEAASGLLELVRTELADRVPAFPMAALEAVRRRIAP
jgi:hypothetical protein